MARLIFEQANGQRELRITRDELTAQVEALEEKKAGLETEIAEHERKLAADQANAAALTEGQLHQKSQETLRKLFDFNLDAIGVIDLLTGTYIDVNQEFLRH